MVTPEVVHSWAGGHHRRHLMWMGCTQRPVVLRRPRAPPGGRRRPRHRYGSVRRGRSPTASTGRPRAHLSAMRRSSTASCAIWSGAVIPTTPRSSADAAADSTPWRRRRADHGALRATRLYGVHRCSAMRASPRPDRPLRGQEGRGGDRAPCRHVSLAAGFDSGTTSSSSGCRAVRRVAADAQREVLGSSSQPAQAGQGCRPHAA